MNVRRTLFALAALLPAYLAPPVHVGAQAVQPGLYQGLAWRSIGPYRGGRTKAVVGVPERARPLLRRLRERRCVEDDRLRPGVDADLRRSAHGLHRRHRGGPVRPACALRGQRRGNAAPRPDDGRRHLPFGGRRGDVDAPGAARRPADPADRGRSARSEPHLRRGAGPPLWPERGAGRVPLDGRRSHVREGALPRSDRRRRRRGAGPGEPGHRLRRPVGSPGRPVGEREVHRAGERPVQVHRRRYDLEPDRGRVAHGGGGTGPRRHRHRAEPADPRLRHRGVARGAGRRVPERRRRRDVHAGAGRPSPVGPGG